MYLIFDTETTGIPRNYRAPVTALDNWPRLVQLAWVVCGRTGKEREAAVHIVKPDGFTIPQDAARVHGITTTRARREGRPLAEVLEAIAPSLEKASILIAHNLAFDEKILGAEFLRLGLPNLLEGKERICTMLEATDYCELPGAYGRYKWPTLQDLHNKLFGAGFEGAHDALVDVRACARCFFKLKKLKVL